MKRNFIKSTFILLFGGMIVKVLGMIIKIFMTREIGLEGISLYMLILPTFSLFITLAQLGFPLSLSRMVAKGEYSSFDLLGSSFFVLFFYNVFLGILIFLLAPFISSHFLHHSESLYPIYAIAFVIPFTTLSSVIRGYFIGKEKMLPAVLSNVLENILRFLFVFLILPRFHFLSTSFLVFLVVLFNVVSELAASIFMLLLIPREKFLTCSFHFCSIKDVFSLSIPNMGSNLVGNITYFLEPILFTNILLFLGYSKGYILQEYGIITGYVYPILLLPSFFTNSLSQSFLSYVTREYESHRMMHVKKGFYLQFMIVVIFSFCTTLLFLLFGRVLLQFIYHTYFGIQYLRFLAPFSFFLYIQSTLNYTFLAMGKTKEIFYSSLVSSFFRIVFLVFFLFLGKGVFGFLYSFILHSFLTTLFQFYRIHHYFD